MRYLEITADMGRSLDYVLDAALKNVDMGGLNMKAHIDYILNNIKEVPSKELLVPSQEPEQLLEDKECQEARCVK